MTGRRATNLFTCSGDDAPDCDGTAIGCNADVNIKTVFLTRKATPYNFGSLTATDACAPRRPAPPASPAPTPLDAIATHGYQILRPTWATIPCQRRTPA